MNFNFCRALRTPSSERFVLQQDGRDFGAVDLHYLANGTVAGTVVIFEDAGINDSQISDLLKSIDETLLPDVSLHDENLVFTVVRGRVVGSFTPQADVDAP